MDGRIPNKEETLFLSFSSRFIKPSPHKSYLLFHLHIHQSLLSSPPPPPDKPRLNPPSSLRSRRLLRRPMASATTAATASRKALLAEDVPWRASPAGRKPVPRIHLNPVLRVQHNPNTNYALAVMKQPDPIGGGFATEAIVEAAGPDCIVPGLATPVKLLGMKVWPIEINFKFVEPIARELQVLGKFMDSAVNLMNASFQDR
ncbi:hypothetical protein Cni_G00488 [Canna indica]|uniref:Uncharacterized protein n=1 Tax=Canna indica TaxID=4628 RepID=A0AAQ3JLF9_9LILI|nr:hypothetical protein Cni_G00488 [Canna indica]